MPRTERSTSPGVPARVGLALARDERRAVDAHGRGVVHDDAPPVRPGRWRAGPGRLLEHHRARRARVAPEQPERDDRSEAVAHQQVDRAVEARRDAVDERIEVQRAVAVDVARVPRQVDGRHAPAAGRQRRADAPPRLGQRHDAVQRARPSPRASPSGSQRSVTPRARRRSAFSAAGSRSGGPWPKSTSSGSRAARRRALSRLRRGSRVRIRGGSCRPGAVVSDVQVEEDVAGDQRAVALAPEGEVAVGVSRRLEHDEAVAEVVALAQRAGDGRPGA